MGRKAKFCLNPACGKIIDSRLIEGNRVGRKLFCSQKCQREYSHTAAGLLVLFDINNSTLRDFIWRLKAIGVSDVRVREFFKISRPTYYCLVKVIDKYYNPELTKRCDLDRLLKLFGVGEKDVE